MSAAVNAMAAMPLHLSKIIPVAHESLRENTYIFIGPNVDISYRTLAHEFGHALTNENDVANPQHVFFPAGGGVNPINPMLSRRTAFPDTAYGHYRRITHDTEYNARLARRTGRLRETGNRFLQSY